MHFCRSANTATFWNIRLVNEIIFFGVEHPIKTGNFVQRARKSIIKSMKQFMLFHWTRFSALISVCHTNNNGTNLCRNLIDSSQFPWSKRNWLQTRHINSSHYEHIGVWSCHDRLFNYLELVSKWDISTVWIWLKFHIIWWQQIFILVALLI